MGDMSRSAQKSVQGAIAATAVSLMTKIGKRHLILVNNGAKTVYVRFNDTGVATVSDFPLVSGRSMVMDSDPGSVIYCVSTICGGADATTVNFVAWN